MTRRASVMVETAPGEARDVANRIRRVNGVKTVLTVSETYGAIALVEADDSDGIRYIASMIALTSGIVRCVVCSEREIADSVEANVFAGIPDDYYSCWCVKEPLF